MKRFLFLHVGFEEPTQEIMDAWMGWFSSIGDSVVDQGSPFVAGREVTADGSTDLPFNATSATGYMIVTAEDMGAAEKLLDGCPLNTSMRIYETR